MSLREMRNLEEEQLQNQLLVEQKKKELDGAHCNLQELNSRIVGLRDAEQNDREQVARVRYCKIPITRPGLIFVRKAFFAGLIFGGAFYWQGILRFKIGLAICIRGLGGLFSGGLFLRGLIIGILGMTK